MGILSKIGNKSTSKTTKGFFFGSPEAEAENTKGQALNDFFEDYLNAFDEINKGKFIITGRKGSGKSAVAKYLVESGDEDTFGVILRPSDLNFQQVLQAIDGIDASIYFEWMILTRLVKLILDTNEGTYAKEMDNLKKFYDRNTGAINISSYKITEINQHSEVSFEPLRRVFGTVSKFFKDNRLVKAHFYEFVPALREIVCQVLNYQVFEKKEFYIAFDDLDIKFKLSSEDDKEQLLDLIRVAKRYNSGYLKETNAKVLIFMRNDIKKHLSGADVTKIFGSYEYCINWYEHIDAKRNEDAIALKKFAAKRIAKNFEVNGIVYNHKNPWDSLFAPSKGYTKTSFRYLLDFTYYRPRDIINILKSVSENDYSFPISSSDLQQILNKYVDYCVGELKDELLVHFDSILVDKIFTCLKSINNQKCTYNEAKEIIGHYVNNPDEITLLLIEYDILIPQDLESGDFYYTYREICIEKEINEYNIVLHPAIIRYFNKSGKFSSR